MPPKPDLHARVIEAAEAALADHHYVSPIDVLVGMRLLAESNVDAWKKGRLPHLEIMIQGNAQKLASAFTVLGQWVKDKGLIPTEVRYTRATRNGTADLHVTHNGNLDTERFFRTHFISPALPEHKQKKLVEKGSGPADPVVFQIVKDTHCTECGAELCKGSMLFMEAGQPLCLACANLAELEFLPSGDAGLTRRASKYSVRKAVVVRFSRSRGHYERQGLLVEPAALEQAEQECVADAGDRAKARVAGAVKRKNDDAVLVVELIASIGELFPGCPAAEVKEIAVYMAARGSGRAGRTAAGKAMDEGALTAAVTAAVRHNHTKYEDMLARGVERSTAREQVYEKVQAMLAGWRLD